MVFFSNGPEYRKLRMQWGTGPEHMPARMPEYLPDKMPDRMSDRRSKFISDRMSVGGDLSSVFFNVPNIDGVLRFTWVGIDAGDFESDIPGGHI